MAVSRVAGMNKKPNSKGKPPKSVRYTGATKETQTYPDELAFSGPCLSGKTRNEESRDNFVLPTVEERLAQLRPSKELLDFYRKKISEYDEEADEMIKKINSFLKTCEKQYELEAELRQREKEIATLQEALSDLQVCLFQEREHVLQLYSQIDTLKVKDVVKHRKKQESPKTLPKEHKGGDDVICFIDKDSDFIIPQYGQGKPWFKIPDQTQSKKPASQELHSKHYVYDEDQIQPTMSLRPTFNDSENLRIQVKTLETQLEEQKQLSQDQIEALTEECHVVRAEAKAQRTRDTEKINTLSSKLKQAQELLHQSTRDFIELRRSTRTNERLWMVEKDELLQELGTVREQSKEVEKKKNKSNDQRPSTIVIQTPSDKTDRSKELISEIKSLKTQLGQTQKLAEMYQAQVVKLEDETSRLKEEKSFSQDLYKDRTGKLNSRLQVLNSRYQDLEKRHRIEIEGFRSDIKGLRTNLKDIEKQVWKAAIHFGEDDKDLVMLRTIKETSERSNQLTGDLKGLKAKLYRLENDLRHL
ncbi:coiled-coil domain-containing protein 77-like [Limulus polyphemus]|uniref:Coiled-coil domain-containing protein 77-like n=1 Tax=Limulus polyphemus TaxID=6850 RepID=A0ABM1C665_LIMPO|nr:coiled-coil domain-containing protein 77-like [Limulus polyphemus]